MGHVRGVRRGGRALTLDYSHDPLLVVASFAIALMAGFTGLSMTRGLSGLPVPARKRTVAMAAIVLGGGIWSMHFVAMLGLQLPVLFYYDALTTLMSALLCILIVGLGLILLHFFPRTRRTIGAAGVTFGTGLLAMHYLGMSGMEACRAVYTPGGLAIAIVCSLVLCTLAVAIAYGRRTRANILLGTLCFAVAVVALHYVAMAGTRFVAVPLAQVPDLVLSNESLAFLVTLAAFVICGGFLLSGATFLPPPPATASTNDPVAGPVSDHPTERDVRAQDDRPVATGLADSPQSARPGSLPRPTGAAPAPTDTLARGSTDSPAPRPVPYEQNGRTLFADPTQIAAFRAEGHYTILYHGTARSFCPWSISEAERRLQGLPFVRAHRSYLINPGRVSGFERKKDSGIAYFDGAALDKAPISRSRLPEVRTALGL